MLRSVGLTTLHDQRRALIAWSVSLALLVGMYAAIWPSMRSQPSMSDFLNQMPKAMRSLFAASGADLSTPVGYVQVELLAFMGPLLLIIYAVAVGAGAVVADDRPHSRGRLRGSGEHADDIALFDVLAELRKLELHHSANPRSSLRRV